MIELGSGILAVPCLFLLKLELDDNGALALYKYYHVLICTSMVCRFVPPPLFGLFNLF